MKPIYSVVSVALFAAFMSGCGGDNPEKLIASSKDFLAKNDSKAAVIQLKNALQKNPNLGEARFLLGKALLESGDPAGADLELRKALELKYGNDEILPLLAKALVANRQAKKLTEEFGKIQLSSGEPLASFQTTLSAAYSILGNRDAAQIALKTALTSMPEYVPAQLADARFKAAGGSIEEAQAIVDGVLTKNPKNYDALFLNGALNGAKGNLDGAVENYKKAIDAKPDFLNAHSAVIATLFRQKKYDDAEKHIDAMKKIAPKNPQTIYLDAQAHFQRKDFKTVRELTQQLLRISPNNLNALQLAGAVEYQFRSYLQAETYLSKVLQQSPNQALSRKLLISIHLRNGNPAKAMSTLLPILDKIEKDSAMLSIAGETFLQNGEPGKAAEYFAKASKLEPNDTGKKTALALAHIAQGNTASGFDELEQISVEDKGSTADMALIAVYIKLNQPDKALKIIDNMAAKQPDNAATHNLRALTLLSKKDIPGARKSFEQALAVNPTYLPAVSSLASLDIADKKPDDARKRFETLLVAEPKNMQALLALAELRANNGGSQDEVASLITKAISANPTELAPRVALIKYYVGIKETKKALASANEAYAALPEKPELLDALGRTQQLSGDINQALISYGKLAALQPASPIAHLRMAEIHMVNKNKDEATKSLKKAVEIKPDLIEAQRALIQLAMEAKKTNEALSIAREIQKQSPQDAAGFTLEGDIYASEKNWSHSINAYRIGLKKVALPELAIKLHSALLISGNAIEAEKMRTTWFKEHPKDIALRLHLADAANARKDYAQAVQLYKVALEIQPNNALVLNNLAWSSGQMKSPKAIEYAEKANQLTPGQPPFMDTLAMLLAEKGETGKAIELLRKAMDIAPQAANIQLNLAKVLISTGNKTEARKELEALAKLGGKFPDHAEVAKLQGAL